MPDVLFIEGSKAYIVNPLSSDSSDYSYGDEHQILEGRYGQGAWGLNRIQVEGYDTGTGGLDTEKADPAGVTATSGSPVSVRFATPRF